jgi:hypothetical protein
MVKTGSAGCSARGRIRWARKGGSGSTARFFGISGNSEVTISDSTRLDGGAREARQTSSTKSA